RPLMPNIWQTPISSTPDSKPDRYSGRGDVGAIIQTNIDAYHAKQCAADEIMDSLERNCGANGYSW
ncbi:hypothetical protein, partial [Xanthomonas dyei]|uniref:hypothetical protein n=1 Tax=Xanthomonas dyei TaxID=743699 RepID=UPI003CCE13D6